MPAPISAYHHESHRKLLDFVDAGDGHAARVDAIVVPTVRPTDHLRDAIRFARRLGCPIVVLCSRSAKAVAVAELGRSMSVDTVAVDIGRLAARLPALATTRLLAGTVFERGSDLSLKRNLGLVLARAVGWRRMLFLDDDLQDVRADQVGVAARLLDQYAVTALEVAGFPDNSVVCHAHRDTDGESTQDSFIGAGAMVVAPGRSSSFFPDIYNEDWFFLLGDGLLGAGALRGVAVVGEVVQEEFDPYACPGRARAEELGDCLGEGLYWLLDEGRTVAKALKEAQVAFWREALERRRRFLDSVLATVRAREDLANRSRMIVSLEGARAMHQQISAELCHEYLCAWSDDLEQWRQYLAAFPGEQTVEQALARLGLAGSAQLTTSGSGR